MGLTIHLHLRYEFSNTLNRSGVARIWREEQHKRHEYNLVTHT